MLKDHWKQINPYFKSEFVNDDFFEKNIIDILDDTFNNSIDIYKNDFYIPLNEFEFLHRGRRGKWFNEDDLLPPSIDIAEKNNIINRWNPPNKRYLYLAAAFTNKDFDINITINEYTCLQELRVHQKEEVTISNFNIVYKSNTNNILNLNYDDISSNDIISNADIDLKDISEKIIKNMRVNKISPTPDNIKKLIGEKIDKIKKEASILCGKILLKELCEAIFIPLDKTEDADIILKDKCYKSFHILAEYLESRNIGGIYYPSTRMKLIGLNGSNLVLFNVDNAKPDVSSFKTIITK